MIADWWRRFRCNVLNWHTPRADRMTFDGLSCGSFCARCGRRILQDSNGDWFAYSDIVFKEARP